MREETTQEGTFKTHLVELFRGNDGNAQDFGFSRTNLYTPGAQERGSGKDALRAVTHRDVSRKDCIDAAEALTEAIEAGVKTAGFK